MEVSTRLMKVMVFLYYSHVNDEICINLYIFLHFLKFNYLVRKVNQKVLSNNNVFTKQKLPLRF